MRRWQAAYLALALTGVALRCLCLLLLKLEPNSGFERYYDVAASLAGSGSLMEDGVPFIFQAPGYPAFLGTVFTLFTPSVLVAQLTNLALGLALMGLTWLYLGRFDRASPWPLLSFAVVCLHPALVMYTPVVCTEILCVVLIAALLLSSGSTRWQASLLSGLLAGCLALTRSQFIVVPLLFLIAFALGKAYGGRRAAHALLFIAGLTVTLGPWMLRNHQLFGLWIPVSANSGYVLLVNNNDANQRGLWMAPSAVPLSAEDKAALSAAGAKEVLDPASGIEGGSRSWPPAADKVAAGIGKRWIAQHPREFVILGLKRFKNTVVNGAWTLLMWPLDGKSPPAWLGHFTNVLNSALLLALAAPLLRPATRRDLTAWVAASIVGLTLLAVFVFEGQGRYFMPAIPALAGLVAYLGRGSWAMSERRDTARTPALT